jgi:N-acyl amino acid synthase of PEP-CTERM/exosortase system
MNAIKPATTRRLPYSHIGLPTSAEFPLSSNESGTNSNDRSEQLVDIYRQWFDTVVVRSESDREEAHRLRYQVYCVEHAFERADEHPDGLERDHYDAHSVHCLLRHKPSGMVAGTVRLVLPRPHAPGESFAMQRICRHPAITDPDIFPPGRTAEVSRFSIAKSFRQRRGDTVYPANLEMTDARRDTHEWRRVVPNMTLGLIEGLVRMSLSHDIHVWCAVMEPALLRLLARFGIDFRPVGPPVIYHGRRQPSVIRLVDMLNEVKDRRPDVWHVLTDGGRHWDTFCAKLSMPGVAALA